MQVCLYWPMDVHGMILGGLSGKPTPAACPCPQAHPNAAHAASADPAGARAAAGTVMPLNVVMLVVGTRGDVQPFVYIGMHLARFGHRVRVATHGTFRAFVQELSGGSVEFYPLGGDPRAMIEFVVKHR
jgi:hypothetical protein